MIDDEEDDEPITIVSEFRDALTARLRQLHADPSNEWRSTVLPLNVFPGLAVAKLAILNGQRDGLADLMADRAEPAVFDAAAQALTTVWQSLMQMTIDAQE